MARSLRIGTRESELAVWQARLVQKLLLEKGFQSELVYIKSEGDVDTVTPLYELGVQGIFTRSLDAALLGNRVDLAVHSMKDVPTIPAKGIVQAAVLERASYKDILVFKDAGVVSSWSLDQMDARSELPGTIATSSIRRIAQWLHRFPHHRIENLRGNVNTRLKKLSESNWDGAIFAAAGLERIGLRPATSVDLDWMLPAPAQGAITIVCRADDAYIYDACHLLDHSETALCTRIERDFLRALMGGCSTPISALARKMNGNIHFQGNITSPDGKDQISTTLSVEMSKTENLGMKAGKELLERGASAIVEQVRKKQVN